MLIVNADDLGLSVAATDRILACFTRGSLTSASAMVFMRDSERAASLAKDQGLDVGLHLNFTQRFTNARDNTIRAQERILRFLRRNKYSFLLYHPSLRESFRDLFKIQLDDFHRLYNSSPTHFDGHHHMHLCMNMLIDEIIPRGSNVRRNFSFTRREKGPINRCYRSMVDAWLMRRYHSTDYLFSLSASLRANNIKSIAERATNSIVELQTHPENVDEFNWLIGESYAEALSRVSTGTFSNLYVARALAGSSRSISAQ